MRAITQDKPYEIFIGHGLNGDLEDADDTESFRIQRLVGLASLESHLSALNVADRRRRLPLLCRWKPTTAGTAAHGSRALCMPLPTIEVKAVLAIKDDALRWAGLG